MKGLEVSQVGIAEMCFAFFVCGVLCGVFYDIITTVGELRSNSLCPQSERAEKNNQYCGYDILSAASLSDSNEVNEKKLRKIFSLRNILRFLTDILFCVVVGVVFCIMLYCLNDGQVRLVVVLPFALGFALWKKTLGIPFTRLLQKLAEIQIRFRMKLVKPIILLVGGIGKKIKISNAKRKIRKNRTQEFGSDKENETAMAGEKHEKGNRNHKKRSG